MNIFGQRFGVEIEFTGITFNQALELLKEKIGSNNVNGYKVYDSQNREWTLKPDGSIDTRGGDDIEFVTPPITYDDMPLLQEIVRGFKQKGGRTNDSCGIHVHVEATNHNFNSLKNLVKVFAAYEDLAYKALKVYDSRSNSYAHKIKNNHPVILEKLDEFQDISQMANCYYSSSSFCERYTGLNLCKVFDCSWATGTVEFRLFNSTLHAGKVRTYVVFALAMSAFAINNPNFEVNGELTDGDFHNILMDLGINPEVQVMKNVYEHLMKVMPKPETIAEAS